MERVAATKKKDVWYYAIFLVHVVFITGWFFSPFWLPWPWIVALSLVLYLQSKYLKYCVITRWQFGSTEVSFWVYYLNKFGIKVTKAQVTKATMIFFVISITLSIIWQTLVWK